MKKIQIVSLIALALSVILWTAGRIVLPLPDWAVRTNGAAMLLAMALLTFSSIRLRIENS